VQRQADGRLSGDVERDRALDEHFDADQNAIDEFCSALRPSNGQGQGNQDGSSAPAPGPPGGR
jgi:hypothetical protein